jgi:hypothetical protein
MICMKLAIKLALAGTALAAGIANAATVINTPRTAGGSDLILFVTNTTTNSFFTQDLGNPLDSIYSRFQVINDGVLSSPGVGLSTPTSIFGYDSALASFLGTTHAGDTVMWSILASDNTKRTNSLGDQRALLTSTVDLSGSGKTFTNANVQTFSSLLNTLVNQVNLTYANGTTSSSVGWGDALNGKNAPLSWVSTLVGNGAPIGSLQQMYMFGTNGTGASNNANVYLGFDLWIDALGNINILPADGVIPLPAAVWLFGSGLLGLIGVGCRRATVAA